MNDSCNNSLVCLDGELPGAQREGGEADDVLDHDCLVCLGIRPVDALPLVHAVDLAHPVDPGGGVDVEQEGEAPVQGVLLAVRVLVAPLQDQGLLGPVGAGDVTRGLVRDGGRHGNVHTHRRVCVCFVRFQQELGYNNH